MPILHLCCLFLGFEQHSNTMLLWLAQYPCQRPFLPTISFRFNTGSTFPGYRQLTDIQRKQQRECDELEARLKDEETRYAQRVHRLMDKNKVTAKQGGLGAYSLSFRPLLSLLLVSFPTDVLSWRQCQKSSFSPWNLNKLPFLMSSVCMN